MGAKMNFQNHKVLLHRSNGALNLLTLMTAGTNLALSPRLNVSRANRGSANDKLRRRAHGRRCRGVSPIIATILLVAITVAMAAVLYVLASGYLRGATPAPMNLELQGLATGHNLKGTEHWINFTAIPSTRGLTTSIFGFKITTPSGGTVNGWNATVFYDGTAESVFTPGSSAWSNNVVVNESEILSFNTGTANLVGSGDSITVYGLGSTFVTGGSQSL